MYFPAGTWLSGSIRLKSNVTLYLEQGSTALATSDPQAYDEIIRLRSVDRARGSCKKLRRWPAECTCPRVHSASLNAISESPGLLPKKPPPPAAITTYC